MKAVQRATEGYFRWEGFVEKVGFEPGVKIKGVIDDRQRECYPSFRTYVVVKTPLLLVLTNFHCVCFCHIRTEEWQWKSVASQFYVQWQFPNCVGALDGKHVQIHLQPYCG